MFSSGSGEFGQLGHGEFDVDDEDEDSPFEVARDDHTAKRYPFLSRPKMIEPSSFPGREKIVQLACGCVAALSGRRLHCIPAPGLLWRTLGPPPSFYYTLALTSDGAVFSWGEGSEGQLGIGYSEDFSVGFLDEYVQRSTFTCGTGPSNRARRHAMPRPALAPSGSHLARAPCAGMCTRPPTFRRSRV